ncbi:SDR family NAD(P)-dependent oxidoreductase [Paracoccus tegillarcae]|uniref:Oxidoreductase n=1 Tax=Paracoccus tegillarcae TaxID=1529068 RepID=A0A2K9EEC2_9RHOB|nr:SDR family oxidoreductase [Paracoccus tegillarcae]AUH33318.1 oxidoreductase [Paracoccus tegillarcae]
MTQPAILVTGASSGIGLAIAQALLEAGHPVIGFSRSAPKGLGPQFTHMPVDLTDPLALEKALSDLPALSGVVHAAGLLRVGPHDSFDHADGARMWQLHVDTAARLIGALAPRLPDGGRIVLIGSRVARGAPGRALYAASKAALSGLTRSVAAELAPRSVTVNIVAPGATDTPMLRDPQRASEAPKLPPIGRMVRPREVAATVAFLLSPDAGAITGQEIVICGGASL